MEKLRTKPDGFGVRHIQYFVLFLAITICLGIRTILNVAVVAMTEEKEDDRNYPTYPEWTDKRNLMISSFFWGYVIFQVPAGQIAKLYGPKLFLVSSICVNSIMCGLVPVFAEYVGVYGVIVSRLLQGVTQGCLFPSVQHLLSIWTTQTERATWVLAVFSGMAFGNVISMPITGWLCATDFGWPLIFYLYGCLGIIWCIIFVYFGANSPSHYKNMSAAERDWLEDEESQEEKQNITTPWLAMFTSPPFIAVILVQMANGWGYYTLLTQIPTYMDKILHYDIKDDSLLSALPYLINWIIGCSISPFSDILIKKELTSIGTSRKIFNSIGCFTSSLALIIICFVGTEKQGVVVFILVVAVGFNAFLFGGYGVNHIDLSPVHSGTLMGIGNGLSAGCCIFAPLMVDAVQKIMGYSETDVALWNTIFCIAAGVLTFAGVIFIVFGSGEIQDWNNLPDVKMRESMPATTPKSSQRLSLTWVI